MWAHEIYGEQVLETELEHALLLTAQYVRENPSYSVGKIKDIFQDALAKDPPSDRHGDIHVDSPPVVADVHADMGWPDA